jgi:MFS family permease
MLSSYKNMPKEVNYLVYAAFLPSVAYGMFYTDISFFLTTIQGVSIGIMGLAITLMGVSTFIASVFLGTVADVYGRKKLLIIGNVLASIILIIFALTTDPITLLTAAILEGISEAAVLVSSNALLADKTEDAQRNSAFSMYGFVTSIAFGLGSIIIYAVKIFELFGLSSKASHVLLYIVISIFGLASTPLLC